jgi:hypothetical protein
MTDSKDNDQTNFIVKSLLEKLAVFQLAMKFFVGKKLEGSAPCP